MVRGCGWAGAMWGGLGVVLPSVTSPGRVFCHSLKVLGRVLRVWVALFVGTPFSCMQRARICFVEDTKATGRQPLARLRNRIHCRASVPSAQLLLMWRSGALMGWLSVGGSGACVRLGS